jgi:ribosomal protein L14E/L6E/L27E
VEIKKGQIVKSVAGHDKGFFYVALEVNNGYALIADGKHRKIEKPKKKSLKHLKPANTVVESDIRTNKELRNVLSGFNAGDVFES